MKNFISSLLIALFLLGSINVAIANDDNYHGNDVKGATSNPTTAFVDTSCAVDDDDDDEYHGND